MNTSNNQILVSNTTFSKRNQVSLEKLLILRARQWIHTQTGDQVMPESNKFWPNSAYNYVTLEEDPEIKKGAQPSWNLDFSLLEA